MELTASDRAELESLARRRKTAQALALRARIVLGCASGIQNKEVAAQVGADPVTVSKWRGRFLADGIDGLRDEPRSDAPRTVDDARIEAVITRTLESLPADATHWSSRGMARTSGLSTSTVQRIWRAFGLQPHREGTFKALLSEVEGVVFVHTESPFALSLSKGQRGGFDRLSPNGLAVQPDQTKSRASSLKPDPLALSLSKGRRWGFDKLSPNGVSTVRQIKGEPL